MRAQTLFKTDTLVFFDDFLDKNILPFRQHFPKMKSIHVPSNKRYTQILKGRPDRLYPVMFSRKYKANRFARYLARTRSRLCMQCQNSTTQGLSIPKMQEIIRWAKASDKPRTVLFDLDKTLLPNNFLFDDKDMGKVPHVFSFEDIAKYMAGTAERFDAVKSMFYHLRTNGVACKIFTDNGWALKDDHKEFNFFLQVMQVLDPHMLADDLIYGYRDKVNTFKRDKSLMKLYRAI